MAADTSKTTSLKINRQMWAEMIPDWPTHFSSTAAPEVKIRKNITWSKCTFVTAAVVATFTLKWLTASSSSEPHDQPEATKWVLRHCHGVGPQTPLRPPQKPRRLSLAATVWYECSPSWRFYFFFFRAFLEKSLRLRCLPTSETNNPTKLVFHNQACGIRKKKKTE